MSKLAEAVEQTIASSELGKALTPTAGVRIAVVGMDRLDLHSLGRGIADEAPVEIGSVTKVFTALLMADAVLRQELLLSTRMDELLFGERWLGEDTITVERLATHTSGLPRLSMSRWSILLHPRDPYAAYTREYLKRWLRRRKPNAMKAKFLYSNLGFATLGLMLEKATSMTYEALLRDRVLQPLGMSETGVQRVGEQDRPARGHRANGRPASLWHWDGYAACGGIVSTMNDLVLAARSLMDPAGPLAAAIHLTTQPRNVIPGGHVGLSWMLPASGRSFWHNGGTFGYSSYLGIHRPSRTAVVIVANEHSATGVTKLGHQILSVVAKGHGEGQ